MSRSASIHLETRASSHGGVAMRMSQPAHRPGRRPSESLAFHILAWALDWVLASIKNLDLYSAFFFFFLLLGIVFPKSSHRSPRFNTSFQYGHMTGLFGHLAPRPMTTLNSSPCFKSSGSVGPTDHAPIFLLLQSSS